MRLTDAMSSVVVLLGLAACGEIQQSTTARQSAARDTVPIVERVRPRIERVLASTAGEFLAAKDVVEDGTRLLILNGKPEELWELPLTAPHTLRRISEPRRFGQASVQTMTAHSTGISFLGLDGRMRVMSRENPASLARTMRVYAPMQRPIALGEAPSGEWIAVHSILSVLGASSFVDSVVVTTLSNTERVTRVYGMERAGPSRPEMFFADRIFGRVLQGRAILVGSEPARVITLYSGAVQVDTLIDAPRRPISPEELERLRRRLADSRTPQFARESPLPVNLSAAVAALPIANGYLVVAEAGTETFVADLYCERRFRQTVLSRASISGIFVTASGLAVIDESETGSPDTPARLSFYRAEDFISECTK